MAGEYNEQIAEIEALLNSGMTSTQEDGQATSFDLDHLRRRLRELKIKNGDIKPRRRIRTIRLDL